MRGPIVSSTLMVLLVACAAADSGQVLDLGGEDGDEPPDGDEDADEPGDDEPGDDEAGDDEAGEAPDDEGPDGDGPDGEETEADDVDVEDQFPNPASRCTSSTSGSGTRRCSNTTRWRC